VLNTKAEDGDNIDCFILTYKKLSTGDIVECEPKAVMEQKETSWSPDSKEIETDHNVIAVPVGEDVDLTDETKDEITDFISHVFDHISGKKIRIGEFLHSDEAQKYIKQCRNNQR